MRITTSMARGLITYRKGITYSLAQTLFPRRRYATNSHVKRSPIHITKEKFTLGESAEINKQLSKEGFVIIEFGHNQANALLETARLFGAIQTNENTNSTGISDIVSKNERIITNNSVESNLKFHPHTDGAYLKGVAKKGTLYQKVVPPKIIILQCVKKADDGGETVLIDSGIALNTLAAREPELLPILFDNECMSIVHGNKMVVDAPVFTRIAPQSYKIRYSFDDETLIREQYKEAIRTFHREYLKKSVVLDQPLEENQLLVLDNNRILHQRNTFSGKRHLRRVWIHDEASSKNLTSLIQLEELYISNKNYTEPNLYQPFLAIDSPIANESQVTLELGIKVDADVENTILSYTNTMDVSQNNSLYP